MTGTEQWKSTVAGERLVSVLASFSIEEQMALYSTNTISNNITR
jgi:hypothetical protein